MVHRYSVSLYDEEIYQDDDGTFVYYFDYADLEQRFDALSSKFAALVEENATLRKRLEPKVNHNDFLSQALNEGDGVYRP